MIARPFWITLLLMAMAPFVASAQVDAGPDVVLECASENGTAYTLNGSVPADPSVVFHWSTMPAVALTNDDTVTPTGLFPSGVTTATLTATVGGGTPESDSSTITVEDTAPPVLLLRADPHYLWPPNHQMHQVDVDVRVQDGCDRDDSVSIELIRATSSEPDNGKGDGNTVNDIQGAVLGTDDRSVLLRAERSGNGNGRVYTLTYRATDGAGNQTEADARVYVPHDASDLKDLIDHGNGTGPMEPICKRPVEAIEQLTALFPGLGSVRNERACRNVCKAWAKSCGQVAVGSAKCAQGEARALALIDVAECKDSDDRTAIRACVADVKEDVAQDKADLKTEAYAARDTCKSQGRRCVNACEHMFDPAMQLP